MDKEKNKKRFGFTSMVMTFCFIIFLFSMLFLFSITYAMELNGKIVDCKDRSGNKILNQECVVENGFDTEEEKTSFYIIEGIILIIGTSILTTLIIKGREESYLL